MNEYNEMKAAQAEARRKEIQYLRRSKKMTWQQIADHLGISRTRVWGILKEGKNEDQTGGLSPGDGPT